MYYATYYSSERLSTEWIKNMKQTMKYLLALLLMVETTNAIACKKAPCYSKALASMSPGDINADGVVDHEDRRYFLIAVEADVRPVYFLTCAQIAIMDLDTNGVLDFADLDLFDNSLQNFSLLPNSNSSWGDVDLSGMVDQEDVLTYLENMDSVDIIPRWGDVNGDGSINYRDATTLMHCLSNEINVLPVFTDAQ